MSEQIIEDNIIKDNIEPVIKEPVVKEPVIEEEILRRYGNDFWVKVNKEIESVKAQQLKKHINQKN